MHKLLESIAVLAYSGNIELFEKCPAIATMLVENDHLDLVDDKMAKLYQTQAAYLEKLEL